MMENESGTSVTQDYSFAGNPTLGTMLREAREQLGLSVMDVSSQIKFAPRQIEALEADDYQHLPEMAFLRGFVRSYAKVLHLDAQVLLDSLPKNKTSTSEAIQAPVEKPVPAASSVQRQNRIWLGAALVLLLVVAGFAIWHFSEPDGQIDTARVESPVALPSEKSVDIAEPAPADSVAGEVLTQEQPAEVQPPVQNEKPAPAKLPKKKQATPGAQPENQPGAQAAGAQASGETASEMNELPDATPVTSLRMEFGEEAWAEIKDKNGKILSSRVHEAGSELRVNGRAPFSLLIGNASNVRLFYRDKEIDLAPRTRHSTNVAGLTLE